MDFISNTLREDKKDKKIKVIKEVQHTLITISLNPLKRIF